MISSMDTLNRFKTWYDQNLPSIRRDYFRFLQFPSISADPERRKDVLDCAAWLTSLLAQGGMHAESIETPGYPIVYAEDLSAGPAKPTVLIYGHYDVQPVDPLDQWKSPPFEPTERGGKIYARGAVDDKGQIFYACIAVLCWKKLGLPLPVNVKFCIEGEEESASMGLSKALPQLKQKLRADSLLIVDFDGAEGGGPAVSLGARGLVALEVTLKGSRADLHSGMLGGMAYNPNRALIELLAKLWDENGRVAVPGFYDGVESPAHEEISRYKFPMSKERLASEFGIHAIGGEKGRTLQESNWFLPTLEINGICGGYTGSGIKTVIPASASAKITCRLVPGQDPDRICKAVETFLRSHAVAGIEAQIVSHGGMGAFRGDRNAPLARAVSAAASEVTKKPCANILSGGSIPIAAQLMNALQIPVIGMGYGLPSDDIHAPNEHFDMERFEKGFLTVARTLELIV